MDSLPVAFPVFFASAVLVVGAGIALARSGEQLAEHTGWGHLWVGAILISVATSLPELVTSVSAVAIDSTSLALGNIMGANMINMWTAALVALAFGVGRVFGGQDPATRRLVLVAVVVMAIAVLFGAIGDFALGIFSVGALLVGLAYLAGMRLVFTASQSTTGVEAASEQPEGSPRRAWLTFAAAAAVIGATSPLLAISANGIAEGTGVASSFMGVLAVAVVTTLPEASVSVTAARRGAYGLVLGNLYGSCAFNVAIVTIIDPVHGAQPVLEAMDAEHIIAGGMAIVLMAMGLLVVQGYRGRARGLARRMVPVMAITYPLALFWVFFAAK